MNAMRNHETTIQVKKINISSTQRPVCDSLLDHNNPVS